MLAFLPSLVLWWCYNTTTCDTIVMLLWWWFHPTLSKVVWGLQNPSTESNKMSKICSRKSRNFIIFKTHNLSIAKKNWRNIHRSLFNEMFFSTNLGVNCNLLAKKIQFNIKKKFSYQLIFFGKRVIWTTFDKCILLG